MPKTSILFFLLAAVFRFNVNAQNQSLDYYITSGLKNSPLLKDYNNQLLSLSYDSLIIKAGGRTQINLSSQVLYAPASKNFGYDSAITNGGNYSALINVNQPLLHGKIKSVQTEAIILLGQTLHVNSKITEIDLKKNITAEYLSAYADYSQIQFNQSLLNLLQEQL